MQREVEDTWKELGISKGAMMVSDSPIAPSDPKFSLTIFKIIRKMHKSLLPE